MVGRDETIEELKEKYTDFENIDLSICSLTDFKKYAGWESPKAWDRYNYAHTKILVDRSDGELIKTMQEKGRIPQDKLDAFIDDSIDGYVNGAFRSVKCIRNGNRFG